MKYFTRTFIVALIVFTIGTKACVALNIDYQDINGSKMLSIRDVFESLGYSLIWEQDTRSIIAGEYTIVTPEQEGLEIIDGRSFLEPKAFNRFDITTEKKDTNNLGITHGDTQIVASIGEPPEYSAGTVTEIPILMYHHIGDPPADASPEAIRLYVSEKNFEHQLRWLQANGYNTVTMQEVIDHWDCGKPIPKNPVVLTFDDGYTSMYEKVTPLLMEKGMVGSFYICTNYRWCDGFLSSTQIEAMHKKGMEIQSHSLSHSNLTSLSEEELRKEICESKAYLETRLNVPADIFCYPHGAVNPKVIAQLKECGYKAALGTGVGIASIDANRFNLDRIPIIYHHTISDFASLMERD